MLNLAKQKELDKRIPRPIQDLVKTLAMTPVALNTLDIIQNWMGHLASDMAGSSTSAGKGRNGMGIPGILLSSLKELCGLPFIKDSKFPSFLDELFTKQSAILKVSKDSTLSDTQRVEMIQKVMDERFDMRSEIALLEQTAAQQMWPVVLNEVLVRSFYFVRHLILEIKEHGNLKNVEWKNVIPFRNRTIVRMMTIASGTFTAIDITDAAIEGCVKGGSPIVGGMPNPKFFKEFIMRVNFVGIGRFSIAIGTDVGMGINRQKLVKERMQYKAENNMLHVTKIYYLQEDMWIEATDTAKAVDDMCQTAEKSMIYFIESWNDISGNLKKIQDVNIDQVEEKNPGLVDDLKDILE